MVRHTGKDIAHLWHMYQPPWQYQDVLERIIKESYLPITDLLANQKPENCRVTININASLTELLERTPSGRMVLDNLIIARANKVVELTDTAAYHAIIPLLIDDGHVDAVERQVAKNRAINGRVFGNWDPKGFFLPEMAYSPEAAAFLKNEGYEWTVTEDAVFDAGSNGETLPHHHLAKVNGLTTLFRSGDWSRKFAMEYPDSGRSIDQFVYDMNGGLSAWFGNRRSYAILAYDFETLGHHHKYYGKETMHHYFAELDKKDISSVHLSDIVRKFSAREELTPTWQRPLRGSWSTNVDQIRDGNFYPLWRNPHNPVHSAYLRLMHKAMENVPAHPHNETELHAQEALDKALNSCPLWWGSPEHFNPQLVRVGVLGLVAVLGALGQQLPVPDYSFI